MKEADEILFVGFGYHPENMAKLGLRRVYRSNAFGFLKGYGTHKGIKAKAWKRICLGYGLSATAPSEGAGTISEFLDELLE
ncbi:MAG: hypothetical protein V2J25_14815 [Desulfatiglans sp.]|nr:hypothetical protein [Desulfatiglans sp.]